MVTMYGIKNCDTIKKARTWLEQAGVEYAFHDYKKDGLSDTLLDGWIRELGYEALLNKRGTTWRKVDESIRDNIDEASARALMLDNPSIIKRPLLDTGAQKVLGFSADEYAALFS
ncbi:ArsC family reductase [Thalassolituus sp. LLYu03]|uniref:ArsC family reductase n=1 Tax=Thalassolituus sp. LLYu03 TaxID=3421656 RepID=UPI003D2BDD47